MSTAPAIAYDRMFRLDGRTAFVSGAAGHLGQAMVRGLLGAGARVILNGRNTQRLDTLRAKLRQENYDPDAIAVCAFDMRDALEVQDPPIHPRFAIDHNRCILCTRCVRVCDEIEGAHTWDVMHRGLETRVQTDMGIPWGESPTCTSCGKCVQVCPVGALFEKGRPVAAGTKEKRPFLPWLRVRQEERGL